MKNNVMLILHDIDSKNILLWLKLNRMSVIKFTQRIEFTIKETGNRA